MWDSHVVCPLCGTTITKKVSVPFKSSCNEVKIRGDSKIDIDYYICDECVFAFAQDMYNWSIEKFSSLVYNKDYIKVDPDYLKIRPTNNSKELLKGVPQPLKHLDYGGGNGTLSKLLKKEGWDSISYDPFYNKDVSIKDLGKFDLITSFEVFEHHPRPIELIQDIDRLLTSSGMLLFSTMEYTRQNLNNWPYAAPRNGHISLYSVRALQILLGKVNMQLFGKGGAWGAIRKK